MSSLLRLRGTMNSAIFGGASARGRTIVTTKFGLRWKLAVTALFVHCRHCKSVIELVYVQEDLLRAKLQRTRHLLCCGGHFVMCGRVWG